MEIKFSKYFETEIGKSLELFSISIDNDNEYVITDCYLKDNIIVTNKDSCDIVDKYLHGFNSGINNIKRTDFENFVLKDISNLNYAYLSNFKELIRIIGITNGLGHYCTKFSRLAVTDNFLFNCINERVAGFVFLDWNEIRFDEKDDNVKSNQIIYVTSSDVEKLFSKGLQEAFKAGKIGSIELPTFNEQKKETIHYFVTSSDLETKFKQNNVLRNQIVNIVNLNLKSRFGV